MTYDPEHVRGILREWVRNFAIDPQDARTLFAEVPAEGIDNDTLGDWVDGMGYPGLAQSVYENTLEARPR